MAVPTIFNDPVVSQAPDYAIDQAIQADFSPAFSSDAAKVTSIRLVIGRKFSFADVTPDLVEVADRYLKGLGPETRLPFLRDMRDNRFRGRRLSPAQVAGVLNCYAAELARSQPAPVAKAPELDEDDRAYEDWLSVTSNAVGKGTYTIVSPLTGDRVTVRLGPWRQDKYNPAQKMRWISFKQGHSYTLYAKQTEGQTHRVLPRMRGADGKVNTALGVLFNDPDEVSRAALAYALESGRCARCDKQLTVPASIYAGYGPECVKHVRS